MTAAAAIVSEPTEEVVAIAHKGFVAFEIATAGVAAHGSRPDIGVDAIAAMGPVLTGIAALDDRLRAGPRHPLLGTGLGARLGDRGRPGVLELSGRVPAPGRAADRARRDGRDDARRAGGARGRHGRDRQRPVPPRPVRELGRRGRRAGAAPATSGHEEVGGVAFWADSALLADAGIPTVVFGPRVGGIHGVDESDRPRLARALLRGLPRRRAGAVPMSVLRAVHVGVGLWGRSWAELVARAPGYRLVAVAESAAEGRAWAEAELGVPGVPRSRPRARSAEADVVVLVSPPSTHRPLSELALAAGLPRDLGEAPCARPRRRACDRGRGGGRRTARDGGPELPLPAPVARAPRPRPGRRARVAARGPDRLPPRPAPRPHHARATGAGGCRTRTSSTWRSTTSTCSG